MQLDTFLQAARSYDSHSSAPPDVAYLYGPVSAGKTSAAILTALMLVSDGQPLSEEALTDPEEFLQEMKTDEPFRAACIHIMDVSTQKNKSAEPTLILMQWLKELKEMADDTTLPSDFAVVILDEIGLAGSQYLRPLMQFFHTGVLTRYDAKTKHTIEVRCPVRLVILLTANCPDVGSVLTHSRLSERKVREEILIKLNNGAIASRMVKWLVTFHVYTDKMLPGIVQTCMDRLLRRIRKQVAFAQLPQVQWTVSDAFATRALRELKRAGCVIRTFQSNLAMEVRAAFKDACDYHALDEWDHVTFTVQDDRVVVKRSGQVQPHDLPMGLGPQWVRAGGDKSLQFVWQEGLLFLHTDADQSPALAPSAAEASIVFLPDPAVMMLIHRTYLEAIAANTYASKSDALCAANDKWLRDLKEKCLDRAYDSGHARCMYRIRAMNTNQGVELHMHFVHGGADFAQYSRKLLIQSIEMPPPLGNPLDEDELQHQSVDLWLKQLCQCPEFNTNKIQQLLRQLVGPRASWPSRAELEAENFPWVHLGPFAFPGESFFSPRALWTKPIAEPQAPQPVQPVPQQPQDHAPQDHAQQGEAEEEKKEEEEEEVHARAQEEMEEQEMEEQEKEEQENDASSHDSSSCWSSSSAAPNIVALPFTYDGITAHYLPMNKAVLAAYCGWPKDRSTQKRKCAALRMAVKRKRQAHGEAAVFFRCDTNDEDQCQARTSLRQVLGCAVRADAHFARVDVIDELAHQV